MKTIFMFIFLTVSLFSSSIYKTIPKNAFPLLEGIYNEVNKTVPEFPLGSYFPALFEQESCISLTHSRCFKPSSSLKHRRKDGSYEEGAGIPQITRVYRKNGRIRFDTLASLRRKYPSALGGLTWKNIYSKPNLQIRAALLLWRGNYNRIKINYGKHMSELDLIAFADAAYNGGYGGVRKDIRKCYATKGCNPNKWFGNVEKTCTKSKRHLYGRRNACDINRDHVRKIIYKRVLKYIIFDELNGK